MEIIETIKDYGRVLFGRIEETPVVSNPGIKKEEIKKEPKGELKILEYPKRPGESIDGSKGIIIFCDGSQGIVLKAKLQDGVWSMCIKPDTPLIKEFCLENEMSGNGKSEDGFYYVIRKIPKDKIMVFREDLNIANMYICLTKINGEGDKDLFLGRVSERLELEEKFKKLEEKFMVEEREHKEEEEILGNKYKDSQRFCNELKEELSNERKEIIKIDLKLENAQQKIKEFNEVDGVKTHLENKELKSQIKRIEKEHQLEILKLRGEYGGKITGLNIELKNFQGLKKRIEIEKKGKKPTPKMFEAYDRYNEGEKQKDIAGNMGVGKQTINNWIRDVKIWKEKEGEMERIKEFEREGL